MASVTFRLPSPITIECDPEVTWAIPPSGRWGSAQITIPLDSPAFSTDLVMMKSGTSVKMDDWQGLGEWNGYVYRVEFDESEIAISCFQNAHVLTRAPSPTGYTFFSVAPSMIMDAALIYASTILSRYGMGILPCSEGPGLVDFYEFSGRSVWTVMQDMGKLTSGELHIVQYGPSTSLEESRIGTPLVYWGGAHGPKFVDSLTIPFDLQRIRWVSDSADQIAEITVVSGDQSYTATASNSSLIGGETISADGLAMLEMVALAHNELDARTSSAQKVTGILRPMHFGIREGDQVDVLLTMRGFDGTIVRGRVLSRTMTRPDEIEVELLLIDDKDLGINLSRRSQSLVAGAHRGQQIWSLLSQLFVRTRHPWRDDGFDAF